jgi:kynurenine 3-monooxygenase
VTRESVTIIGAGPVGTLLALLLARDGRAVQLLERRADPRQAPADSGRSINLALAARGLLALERAGVLESLRGLMVEMRGRQVHEPGGSSVLMNYGLRPSEVIHAISRSRLNAALIEAAAHTPQITLRFSQRCLDVDPASGSLQWREESSGQVHRESAALLIAADGAGSAVRAAFAARGVLQASEVPLDHDYKELLIPASATGGYALERNALHIWPRGGYMLIALPNPDGTFTATLFLPARGVTASFDALHAAGAARAFFAQHFPDVLALLPDFEAQYARNPQGKLATLYCWPWHQQRSLLIGDAAHAIVPFHGQGLNCGFEDCVVLARLLAAGDNPQAACAAFERERRPNTDAIAAMALENYEEMRSHVLAPDFARRKQLAAELERRFPQRFIPRYSMVMFHPEIAYAEAQRRGAMQEQVLDALLAAAAPADGGEAARLLGEAGL